MKRFIQLLSFALAFAAATTESPGQSEGRPRDVFILVDVSGSMVDVDYKVLHSRVQEAKNLVADLLKDQFDVTRYDRWNTQLVRSDLNAIVNRTSDRRPLLEDGSRLFLGWIGDPDTSRKRFESITVQDVSQDVDRLFSSFPKKEEFRDQRTFLWLARAKTRERALEEKIGSYLLIEITDAREDKEALSDPDDIRTVREFKSLAHVPTNGEIGAFTHRDTVGEYVLQVNIRLIGLKTDFDSPPPTGPSITNLEIPDDVPVGGEATVTWSIFNGSPGLEFEASINAPGQAPQKTRSLKATFSGLPQGDHTVTISAPGADSVSGTLKVPGDKALPPLDPLKILTPADGDTIQATSIVLEVEIPSDAIADVPLKATISSDQLPAPIEESLKSSEKRTIDLAPGDYTVDVFQTDAPHRPHAIAGFIVEAPEPASIRITSPREGADPLEPGLVQVSWSPKNIPKGSNFKATVFADGANSKFEPQSKESTGTRATFNIEKKGEYYVRVMSLDVKASPASREFKVGGGSGLGFLVFLLLAAAAVAATLIYRSRAKKTSDGVTTTTVNSLD